MDSASGSSRDCGPTAPPNGTLGTYSLYTAAPATLAGSSFFAATDVRLFQGFSFNVFGSYSKINDLIGLPKGEASTEEILLRLRQLATHYSYSVNFGISYSFGSIFNSVVNPRYGGGGGGMMMIVHGG